MSMWLFSATVTGNCVRMTTWKPVDKHGELDAAAKNKLPDSAYAFAKARKEPLTDAKHVRNAIARFDQVQDVTDAERDEAFANIRAAAKHYGVDLTEKSWHELGKPSR
jgi:hypothetical protein